MAVDGSSVCFGDPQWSRTLNVPPRGSVSSPPRGSEVGLSGSQSESPVQVSGGICLPFPFNYLLCLSWFPEMSSSPPFSSQAKLSAVSALDLPAPNWQPDLLLLPWGVGTKP